MNWKFGTFLPFLLTKAHGNSTRVPYIINYLFPHRRTWYCDRIIINLRKGASATTTRNLGLSLRYSQLIIPSCCCPIIRSWLWASQRRRLQLGDRLDTRLEWGRREGGRPQLCLQSLTQQRRNCLDPLITISRARRERRRGTGIQRAIWSYREKKCLLIMRMWICYSWGVGTGGQFLIVSYPIL